MADQPRTDEQLLAELDALRHERASVEALIAESTDACAIVDWRGVIRHVSPRLARWLGWPERTKLCGKSVSEIVVPDDRLVLAGMLAAVAGGVGSGAPVEPRFVRADGTEVSARVTVRGAGSGTARALLVRVDCVAPRDGGMLRVLETAVDHLDDIVFITEAEPRQGGRRIVFVNRAFTEITGYQPEEVIGQTPSMTIGPATDRAVLKRIEARLKARESVHEELLKYRKDGTCYWVELDIVPVWDDLGVHTHWVSVQRDVTERKSRELRVVESERRAAVGAAFGRVGTELSAPLLRVQSSLERASAQLARLGAGALDEDALGERVGKISATLASARDQADHLAQTVHQVARGTMFPEPSVEIDVREVLETSIALVRKQIQRNAQLVREFAPARRVTGSAATLGEVFTQLLRNAIEALTPGDTKRNVVRVSTRMDHAGWVLAEIEDNGHGFPPELRDRIFLPFFTTRHVGAHEGLGLTLCREALIAMNGTIECECEPGRRTTFRVRLPAAGALDAIGAPRTPPAND